MKFLIVSFALVAAISAQYQGYKEAPGHEASARILEQNEEVLPNGAYSWSYKTENGIGAHEEGAQAPAGPNGEPGNHAQGGYEYTGPDGVRYAVEYVAGPGGFVARGAHLPEAPPIPEQILRSLAYNAANPQKEDAYYKAEVTPKPYYAQPISSTPIPFVPQYKTPQPYYPSVRPTYQTPFQGVSQQPFGYTPQAYQAGRR